MIEFENFKDLKSVFPVCADALYKYHGNGKWQNGSLHYYSLLDEFAEYELTEGLYHNLLDFNQDFKLMPNPLNYIDLEELGEDLANIWDESLHWTNGDVVIVTKIGW